ncbi:DUF4192 family protein [Rathayibacter sp. KR2-224]|uniref:DUF4192 family protein n=1 Tax=Rathayibacter sp. KR2-224 TaxID=3400913 RepID=UPI003BFFD273
MPVGRARGHPLRESVIGMPFSIVASSPLDLLTYVPELVGFEPRRSLVLVTLCGNTTGGTLRVDLPDGGHAATDRVDFARAVVGIACKVRGADALIPILFTDESCASGPPHAALFAALRTAASAAGFAVHDALFVAPDGWGRDSGVGGPREELDAAWRLRRLDPDSRRVRQSPEQEASLPEVGAGQMERTMSALASLQAEEPGVDPVWFAEYAAQWDPGQIGPVSAALAADLVSRPWARDVLLLTWAWGASAGRRALRFQEQFSRGEPARDEQIAMALAGLGEMPRPSPERLEQGIALLRQVAARLHETERAPCLTAVAWLNWALGRSSVAGELVRRARKADGEYGFAELMETMLERGLLPDWAFRAGSVGSAGTIDRASRRRAR